ncbi:high molecular weight rubredoxin [Ruminiclostridium hungatei]|uniref:High molecular weight rubredoxin n=1 Tax=Ruminiclostridium hungatei TaxID=48256 RepID=A0A1V4SFH2_RUMHU|nr:flavin reductase [Ruminiclostridium hungatei]OPX42493.1 high molecular weight rubredoxin [Ruminiclostridium hungatei]
MDSKSLYKISYGLYLISASYNGKQNGCISNTITQVSASPAKLTAALSKNNYTTEIIKNSGRFTATVISQAVDMNVIAEFGFKSGREGDKFEKFNPRLDDSGVKYLAEDMCARFSCKVLEAVDVGSHYLFIGQVEEAEILSDIPVMTYEYYHQTKKGTTPANAPSYQPENKKSGYRCTVCGYIEEKDNLPEGYVCPICSNGTDYFEKI